MDLLDELIAAAQARQAAVPPMPAGPARDVPMEHQQVIVARVRRQAEVAEHHLENAIAHYRDLVRLVRRINGALIPAALDDIEMCRREAFNRVRALSAFADGQEARVAVRTREKQLMEPFRGE